MSDTTRKIQSNSEKLLGKRYGLLETISFEIRQQAKSHSYFNCICECGGTKKVRSDRLKSGEVYSCGCFRRLYKNAINEIGNRYGSLTVIRASQDKSANRGMRWICRCDCGKEISRLGGRLRDGHNRSCGCMSDASRLIDLSGKAYPRFKVIGRHNKKGENPSTWDCVCECGRKFVSSGHSIRSGIRKTCSVGTCHASSIDVHLRLLHQVYATYKCSAKKHGRIFEIEISEFRDMASKDCHYCGKSPSNRQYRMYGGRKVEYTYSGLDRVDSSLGYFMRNLVPCCGECNKAKNNLPLTDFYAMVKRIYERHLSQDGFKLTG